MTEVEEDLLGENNAYTAKKIVQIVQTNNIFVLNLVSSPGAWKTTLLVETIKVLKDKFPIAVIEGNQQTEHDADKIRAAGVWMVQAVQKLGVE